MLKTAQTTLTAGVIELGVGHPSLEMLPLSEMREAAAHRFAQADPSFLQYGAEWGDGHLRRELAAFLAHGYGLPVHEGDLFVSGGVSQALGLICEMFTRPGDTVLVEDPTYFLALDIFRDHDLNVVPAPLDDQGLRMDVLAELVARHRPRLVYTIPTHQNPTGTTLSAGRREDLVRLAQAHDFLVVADEVYHLLTYGAPPPPAFSAHVGTGQVLSLGSFSKILAPGTRLGWIHGHPQRLDTLARNGVVASGGGFSPLGGGVIRSLLELGTLESYLAGLRRTFGERAGVLCSALDELRPLGVDFTRPGGGYFVWLTLPPGVQSAELLPVAVEEGVRFQPGNRFSPAGTQGAHARLCFAYYEPNELREGAARLGRALRRVLP